MLRLSMILPTLVAGVSDTWTLVQYSDDACQTAKADPHMLSMALDDNAASGMLSASAVSESAADYPVLSRSTDCLTYGQSYMKMICINNVTDVKFGLYKDKTCSELISSDNAMSYDLAKKFAEGECVNGANFAFTGHGKLSKPLPLCAHPCADEGSCMVYLAANPAPADHMVATILGLLWTIPLGAVAVLTYCYKRDESKLDSE